VYSLFITVSTIGCTTRFACLRSGRPVWRALLRAHDRPPEHLLGAGALLLRLGQVVQLAHQVLRVHVRGRERHDVLDLRLVHRIRELRGQRRVLGGEEDLEEALELGFVDALREADPAGLAALEVREQRVVLAHERGGGLHAHAIQVEVVGHGDQRDLLLLVEQVAQHAHELLELALERHVRDVVRARGAHERHDALDDQRALLGERLGVAAAVAFRRLVRPGIAHAAFRCCSAASHACRTGARRDCTPASSAAIALGVPMRARQRATAWRCTSCSRSNQFPPFMEPSSSGTISSPPVEAIAA
jgi:hypothetical protein